MNAYLANNPAVTSYQAGTQYNIQFNGANGGPATLQFNSLAAVPIVSAGNVLAPGAIAAGATMALIYSPTGYEGAPAFILGAAIPIIPPGSIGATQMAGAGNANLVPDAGFQLGATYWNLADAGAMAIAQGVGGAGQNGLELAGSGLPSGNLLALSGAIPVTPETTLILSGYIDARNVATGSPAWLVMDAARTTVYASAPQAAGTVGTVASASFAVPAGVASLVVIFSTENCTVANGLNLIAAAPQLEGGETVTQFKPSLTGPNFTQDNLPDGSTYARVAGVQNNLVQTASIEPGAVTAPADATWSGSQTYNPAASEWSSDNASGQWSAASGQPSPDLVSAPLTINDPTDRIQGHLLLDLTLANVQSGCILETQIVNEAGTVVIGPAELDITALAGSSSASLKSSGGPFAFSDAAGPHTYTAQVQIYNPSSFAITVTKASIELTDYQR